MELNDSRYSKLLAIAKADGAALMQDTTSVNFLQALEQITEHWSPRVVGRVNDQYVKVAKVQGQLAWHKHDFEDEMFLVVYGRLILQFEDKEVVLNPGDFYVVPKGTMHNPVAEEECGIVLIETVTTQHTGDVVTPLTRSIEEQLSGV
jgi:mannose-6-phosphate isomerase-like protein (cupin superfamily)